MYNKFEIFKFLLSQEPNKSHNINELFKYAITSENFEIIEYMINNYKSLIHNSIIVLYDEIYYDVINKEFYKKTVKFLVENGAKIIDGVIKIFCDVDDLDMVKFLLDNSRNFNINKLSLVIEKISSYGNIKIIKFFEDNYNKLFTKKALNEACKFNNFEIAKIILKYVKPDENMLIKAYKKNNYNIVVLLIENGLNVNILKDYINTSSKVGNYYNYNDVNNYLFEKELVI